VDGHDHGKNIKDKKEKSSQDALGVIRTTLIVLEA
jgi:hypothetical protein